MQNRKFAFKLYYIFEKKKIYYCRDIYYRYGITHNYYIYEQKKKNK